MFDTTQKYGITIDFLFAICYYILVIPKGVFHLG